MLFSCSFTKMRPVLLTMSVNFFFFFGFDATEPTLLVYQLDEWNRLLIMWLPQRAVNVTVIFHALNKGTIMKNPQSKTLSSILRMSGELIMLLYSRKFNFKEYICWTFKGWIDRLLFRFWYNNIL